MIPTDWLPPGTGVLRRLSDARVQQYWDEQHALARRMAADARAPQPVQECCVRNGILWDLAAVYPPDARWDARMPPAAVFNGPVVDIVEAIEQALPAITSSLPAHHAAG